jgi:hypothetical protein
VLFERRLRDGLADGTITVAFRRWKRPQVVAGGRYGTGLGIVEAAAVDVVEPPAITPADVADAGYPSVDALLADVPERDGSALYRVRFRPVDEPDPRAVLAGSVDLSDGDVAALDARLDRMDRAGPWTAEALRLVAEHPGRRAPDLAEMAGRETQPFKRDVRKLKELGLTISLEVGYRLSPRGEAYLARTRRR